MIILHYFRIVYCNNVKGRYLYFGYKKKKTPRYQFVRTLKKTTEYTYWVANFILVYHQILSCTDPGLEGKDQRPKIKLSEKVITSMCDGNLGISAVARFGRLPRSWPRTASARCVPTGFGSGTGRKTTSTSPPDRTPTVGVCRPRPTDWSGSGASGTRQSRRPHPRQTPRRIFWQTTECRAGGQTRLARGRYFCPSEWSVWKIKPKS